MDSDRMAQAIGNLLSNAIKFTPAGGRVSTTLTIDSNQLALQVADSGVGIPAEERERIFQPFYRGGHGRRIVQGMGLGLSIARDIATAHGGGIELLPTESGSCFILRIPIE
jgi:signal transduction histidine kinase